MSTVNDWLKQLREYLNSKQDENTQWWKAAAEAIGVIEKHADSLQAISMERLEVIFKQLVGADPVSGYKAVIEQMTPRELISDMEAGAEEVAAEAARLRAAQAALLEIVQEIGQIGIRILLAFLVI